MRNDIGKHGEALVVSHLRKNGYEILERNYRNAFGELDIVAREGDVICFIEVKTRTSDDCGDGLEAITEFKQRQLIKMALSYLMERNELETEGRFDVVAVAGDPDECATVEIIKNAFEVNDNKW